MTLPSPLVFGASAPLRPSPRTASFPLLPTDPPSLTPAAVPKKATQDVDFAPSLRSVIAKSYSESPDAYADEIAALNRARQDALRGSAGSDATARDLLYKYFGQLELLELRFPDLRVPFPW